MLHSLYALTLELITVHVLAVIRMQVSCYKQAVGCQVRGYLPSRAASPPSIKLYYTSLVS